MHLYSIQNYAILMVGIPSIVASHTPFKLKITLGYVHAYMLRITAKYADWKETRVKESYNSLSYMPTPPPSLRLKVGGAIDRQEFLDIGNRNADDIDHILQTQLKKNLSSFHDVLDFGCGCGRTLIWLYHLTSKPKYYGTDIDKEAIEWCKNNLKFAEFGINNALPPMRYMSDTFDIVLAISVFTHLDEGMQLAWIQELYRVLKPKGILLISVHGENALKNKPKNIREEFESKGFVFVKVLRGKFPTWYQLSYQTETYIRQKYDRYFKLVSYLERALNNHQDVALLEKR
jgi:SAM-dependent methyltransferase